MMNTINQSIVRILLLFCFSAGLIDAAYTSINNDYPDFAPPPANVVLQLTVRIPDQNKNTQNDKNIFPLKKDNLLLTINQQPRRILEVTPRTEAMDRAPDFPGRNFVISFQVSEFDQNAENALNYFITDVIIPGDSLLLLSPIKAYNIDVTTNKNKMIHNVTSLLEKDCKSYNKMLTAILKTLETKSNRMYRLFRGGVDDGANITGYKMVGMFLSTFPQVLLKFLDQFLYPDLAKYRQVIELLGNREGQRWWIHFQDGDHFAIISRIEEIANKIGNYCSQSPLAQKSFSQNLRHLEKILDLAAGYPTHTEADLFLEADIRYNALLWNRHQDKSSTSQAGALQHLVSMMQEVSFSTGGFSMHTPKLENGLKSITHHQDRYYLLSYFFDGNLGDKKIHVSALEPAQNLNLSYLRMLRKQKVYQQVRYALTDRISISGFKPAISKTKPKIEFSIDDVTYSKEKKCGLVKVRIELTDSAGETVFQAQNTLRTSKRKVSLSIPLAPNLSGKLKLKILAFDLIANRMTSFEQEITL